MSQTYTSAISVIISSISKLETQHQIVAQIDTILFVLIIMDIIFNTLHPGKSFHPDKSKTYP